MSAEEEGWTDGKICLSRPVPCFGVSWKNSLGHENLTFLGHVWGPVGSYLVATYYELGRELGSRFTETSKL